MKLNALEIRNKASAFQHANLMTNQEVCTALNEWKEVRDELETCKTKLEAVFCSGGSEFMDMHLLQMFMMNRMMAEEEVNKLIGKLSVKKENFYPISIGTFGKDIQKMVSGFKLSAIQFDIKNQGSARPDFDGRDRD